MLLEIGSEITYIMNKICKHYNKKYTFKITRCKLDHGKQSYCPLNFQEIDHFKLNSVAVIGTVRMDQQPGFGYQLHQYKL